MSKEAIQETKPRGITRREFLKAAGAAALGAAAGLVLPDSLKKTAKADAPVEPVLRKRVFIPLVNKEYKELWPAEFGAPERGVTLFNRGIKTGIKIGDRELFENMMYLKDKYGRRGLKLEVYFYDSSPQMNQLSGISPWDPSNRTILYDFWARYQVPVYDKEGNMTEIFNEYPPTFYEYGAQRFQFRAEDNTLEFHLSLPNLREGRSANEDQLIKVSKSLVTEVLYYQIFLVEEDGKPHHTVSDEDRRNYRVATRTRNGSAFLIVMRQ